MSNDPIPLCNFFPKSELCQDFRSVGNQKFQYNFQEIMATPRDDDDALAHQLRTALAESQWLAEQQNSAKQQADIRKALEISREIFEQEQVDLVTALEISQEEFERRELMKF
jgi:hypothetical protein